MSSSDTDLMMALCGSHRERVRALRDALDHCRGNNGEPAVHALRLAARHLQPLLDIQKRLSPGDEKARRLRKAVRRIIDLTNDLRDLQTHVLRLAAMPGKGELRRALLDMAAKEEARQRRRVGRKLERIVVKPGKFRCEALRTKAVRAAMKATCEASRARMQRRIARLDDQDPAGLHRVRVAVKRHRYLLVVLDMQAAREQRTLAASLERMQHRLGDWHDARMFAERLQAAAASLAPRQRARCVKLAREESTAAQAMQRRLIAQLRHERPTRQSHRAHGH
ncbi:MAG: CHAD domain-containing protein [Flavobacteriales bacterium]|nr:CHAD domain-containing protein [Flavobacteriales bacterium]